MTENSNDRRMLLNMSSDQEINIDDYEIVGAEFFAQVKEPAFTVNVNKITVNVACVRLLPEAEYVKILIKRDEKKLVLMPCSENDIYGYRWAREKGGKRYASQRTGETFVLILCDIMNWNPDNRYKILGRRMFSKGEAILVFDLTVAQCFEKTNTEQNGKNARRMALPTGWNGKFGPTYGENQRTLQVDTFEGYTVFSVKGNSELLNEKISDEQSSDEKQDAPFSAKFKTSNSPVLVDEVR
ncbi:MAG: hypothetical protein IJ062_02575 [Firmicutes bacterium]|nr:hypothetical protein [Bacillota bacterium]